MIELEALNTLAANDPSQSRHCVQLLEWFDYRWALRGSGVGWGCVGLQGAAACSAR